MEIRILTVGKIKEKYLNDGIAEYAKRLSRYCKLNFIQVPDEKTPDKASDALNRQIKETEGNRLLSHIREQDYVIALAIDGKMLDSVELSDLIARLGVQGKSSIVFVIGLLLLAWEQDWIKNLNFTLILAIVLVMLGVYFIVRAITGSRKKAGASVSWNAGNIQWRSDGGDLPTYSAFFTGTNVKSESRNLMGGTCSATFGRLRVDLSEVSVNHDITLFCNAIFGQVTVSAPKGVRIVCKNVPILGGV